MPKHNRVWNANVYESYMRDGRGRGSGSGYAPWVYIQDFASRGIVSRVKGRTTGRVHHLMSNNELAYFYMLDWSEIVTDIREQYPLLDLGCAIKVAQESGIKYPIDNISGYPYVMTCDFMITTVAGLRARTIKMTSELGNCRTLEKLEIERRYWLEHDVDWKIVTEHDILFQQAKNIEWLYTAQDFDFGSSNNLKRAQDTLLQLLLYGRYSVLEATKIIESTYLLHVGMGLQLFKQLVLNREISINLGEPFDINANGVLAA